MRTIAWLKKELEKFPDDAVCYAYEGEVIGLIIYFCGERTLSQGVIFCSESDDSGKETQLIGSRK